MICKIGFLFLAKLHDRKRLEMNNLTILIWIPSVTVLQKTWNFSKKITQPEFISCDNFCSFFKCVNASISTNWVLLTKIWLNMYNFNSFTEKSHSCCENSQKSNLPNTIQAKKRRCFLKKWQKFHTTAGRDKFQLYLK